MKKKSELNYGALVSDKFDAGVPVSETIAKQMFCLRDDDFSFEFAHVDWEVEREKTGVEEHYCEELKEEVGRYWVIVYRYYPPPQKRGEKWWEAA